MEEKIHHLEARLDNLEKLTFAQLEYIKTIRADHEKRIKALAENVVSLTDLICEFIDGSQLNFTEITKPLIEMKGGAEISINKVNK